MDRQARIAFVGAGNHSTQSLYPNIAHIPEFDLVAVCDLEEEKARRAARVFGALEAYTDLGTMLDAVAPDAVCICGLAEVHHAVGLEVLRRGIPVFMEKPPAPSPEAALELVQAADAAGTWGMVGFMKRFAPSNLVAREYMQTQAFGHLTSLTLMHGAGPYDDTRRMLYYNGIHLIDLGRFLGGEVRRVSAFEATPRPGARAIAATMEFVNGAVGQLNMNSGATWSDCFEQVYVTGEGCQMLLDSSRATEVMTPGGRFAAPEGVELYGWSQRYYVSGNMAGWTSGGHYTRGYWGELSHFAKAVLGEAEPTPDLRDGLTALRIIEAVLESVREGGAVAV